jgi:ABC-type multidrug transport system ATPase subunit
MEVSTSNDSVLLKASDIHFEYRRNTPLIRGVDLDIEPGEIIGISGENGSGKSTLLKLLVGLLRPRRGTIITQGRVGYSPQQVLLFENLTVMENFRIFGKGIGLSKEEIEIEAYEIMKTLNFLQYCDTLVKNLSGGTAQKLNFGISLLGEPDIFILDEPYQGLDYASFLAFWDIQLVLREKGKAIVIVSHLIEDKSKFTRSFHLVEGQLLPASESIA